MNRSHLSISIFIFAFFMAACSQETHENEWHPNVRLLDAMARSDVAGAGLARDVEKFYTLLRKKQWHETYEGRAKAFREDVLESEYLKTAKKYETGWELVNYEVLSIDLQGPDVAVLICRFIELPGNAESYSTVFWHKEEGVWKCLSAGPKKLNIFDSTRPPIINWR